MGTRVLMAALVVLAGIDLEHQLVPNVTAGPAAFVGLVVSVAKELSRWWVYLISAFGVAAGLFTLAWLIPSGWREGT